MEPFPGIPHDDLLKLVFSIAVLLAAARALGEMMRRIGQPVIVGELLAGVVLGPALLSGLLPALGRWLVPQTEMQSHLLDVVGMFGIMFLILVVGLETDLTLIKTHVRSALSIGLMGFVVPFGFGIAVAPLFPDTLIGESSSRFVFALFLAVALALSAIPVLAKILSDLRMLRSTFGQVTLAAGMFDDIVGWTALGLVTSLAAVGTITLDGVMTTTGALVVFFAGSLWLARPAVRWGLRLLQDRTQMQDGVFSFVVVFAFAWGAFSHSLNLEPVLGSFVAGIIFARQRRLTGRVIRQLESVTMGVFAPIFLAIAGLRLQVDVLFDSELLWLTLVLVGAASLGKLIGAFIGAKATPGTSNRHALAFGAALNARGVLGIIVAVIGQTMGFFGPEVYAMIVITSLLTSLAAPVALKRLLRPELRSSDLERDQLLDGYRRILVPVRMRADLDVKLREIQSTVIEHVAGPLPAVTLMTALEEEATVGEGARFLDDLVGTLPRDSDTTKRVVTGDPAKAILDEAEKGYDLILLGASDREPDAERLFEPIIDKVVRMAPCETMIFSAGSGSWPPRRILVPTAGSVAATRAAELAFSLGNQSTQVVLFHVLDPELVLVPATRLHSLGTSMEIGQSLMNDLRQVGERSEVQVATEMITGSRVVSAIIDRAERDIDLIVIGTHVRTGSPRLFLGPKVERLIKEASCSIIVLNHAVDRRHGQDPIDHAPNPPVSGRPGTNTLAAPSHGETSPES